MKITILTNEYPPNVYGGAGVHVDYLSRELARLQGGIHQVNVLSFGQDKKQYKNLQVQGINAHFPFPSIDQRHQKVFTALLKDVVMAGEIDKTDIVHCHTWYTYFAGCLIQELHEIPLIVTTHSLEPHRPWKAEQLGTGYRVSSWLEQVTYQKADGIIAVSKSMQQDVQEIYSVNPEKIKVIYNGIDIDEYQPVQDKEVLEYYGINPDLPYILFVGRITAQKGLIYLLNAIPHLDSDIQVVLCAASPDTKEIAQKTENSIYEVKSQRKPPVIWIAEVVPKQHIVPLYSQAAAFVCPSIYEPFGIINVEAMACGAPVIASKVGGIPEIVEPESSGILVPFKTRSHQRPEPIDPEGFSRDLAQAINRIVSNPDLRQSMSRYARKRVKEKFSWTSIASQTLDFYRSFLNNLM